MDAVSMHFDAKGATMTSGRLAGAAAMCVVAAFLLGIGSGVAAAGSGCYLLVAPNTVPGSGSFGTPVLRFVFAGTGPLQPTSDIPADYVDDPAYAAFSDGGELFVTNRHGNTTGLGSISRFTFDADLNVISKGRISGNSLNAVHGIAFSPTGELFAANANGGTISRFLFDSSGNAIPNGVIQTGGPTGSQGLAFDAQGDLFFAHWYGVIERYTFDAAGQAMLADTYAIDAGRPHGIAFRSPGELFVCDYDGDMVRRFLVDSSGLSELGTIPVPGGPVGAAFSPEGELFVTCHSAGGVHRFLFDAAGNAIPNGSTATVQLGGVAILPIGVQDDLPPVITIAAPEPYGLYAAGTLALDFSAYDDVSGWLVPPDLMGTLADAQGPQSVASGYTPPAGVYTLTVSAVDAAGNAAAPESVMFVVYDPGAGFVTGGGWLPSPAGAYRPDPSLSGRANFGFISRYKAGASTPTGQTEFVFQTGDLNFHSSSYEWLVVNQNGSNAQFKGSGTINGAGSYKFMLWAGDGDPDTFRIRIGSEENGIDRVVYDNGVSQPLGGGSIVIHQK